MSNRIEQLLESNWHWLTWTDEDACQHQVISRGTPEQGYKLCEINSLNQSDFNDLRQG